MNSNESTIRKLWKIFNARKFPDVKPLLHKNFVCVWPQSKELIRGADNFIAVNENYPGEWAITIRRILSDGDIVVSDISLTDGKTTVFATSFFEFKGGKIVKATEYWGDTYAAPEWRRKWAERI